MAPRCECTIFSWMKNELMQKTAGNWRNINVLIIDSVLILVNCENYISDVSCRQQGKLSVHMRTESSLYNLFLCLKFVWIKRFREIVKEEVRNNCSEKYHWALLGNKRQGTEIDGHVNMKVYPQWLFIWSDWERRTLSKKTYFKAFYMYSTDMVTGSWDWTYPLQGIMGIVSANSAESSTLNAQYTTFNEGTKFKRVSIC